MPRKIRELKADLRASGFGERSGKGSHTVWHHPLIGGHIVVAGNDGDDAKRYQERAVRAAIAALREAQGRQR